MLLLALPRSLPRLARQAALAALLSLSLLLPPADAAAARIGKLPDGGLFGLSWVANLTARQRVGLSIYHIRYRDVGWFVECKFGPKMSASSSAFYEDLTAAEAVASGHELLEIDRVYDIFDVGLTYGLSDILAVYAGVGVSDTDGYSRFHDPNLVFGINGNYWVPDATDDKYLNVVTGAMLRVSRLVVVHVGYDAQPAGVNVGLGLAFGGP